MTTTDLTMSIEQASRACGVSDETIRRRLRAKRLSGAFRQGKYGTWRIPITALIADGFTLTTTTDQPFRDGEDRNGLSRRLEVVELLLTEREERITALERNLDDLRLVLRVLGAQS